MPAGDSPDPLRCPECPAVVARAGLDSHLRQAHRVYQFRGARRSLNDTLAALLADLGGPQPGGDAWATLEAIAREDYGPRADTFLASLLSQTLARAPEEERPAVVTRAAEAVVAGGGGPALLPSLAAETEPTPRLLALALAAQLPRLHPAVAAVLLPLLADRDLPGEMTLAAAAALLRAAGADAGAAEAVCQALIVGLGKARSAERLRQLEQAAGPNPTLEQICTQIEEQVRMACPRCGVELRRPEMVQHLWQEHQLVLDGRRVREPWPLIEEWLDEARNLGPGEAAAALLARGRALAQRLDPAGGLLRVHRLILARGIADPEARQALLAEAVKNRASLCPHCFALIGVPGEAPTRALNVWQGRLSGQGYRVEVATRGLFTRLELEAPGGLSVRGPEPGRRLTQAGAQVFFAGPLVLAAVLVAFGLLAPSLPPLLPVVLLLAGALAVALFVRLNWRRPTDPAARAVDHAWTRLVPRLHPGGYVRQDGAFVAGLALTSAGRGRPDLRADALKDSLALTEKAVAAGTGAVEHLAALRRLAIDDAAAAGADPVPLVVAQVGRCFDGKLSLAYAETLLEEWQSNFWTKGQLARLRVLLCDRAFEAGFEVRNLLEAARAAPTLGAVLESDDADALACLRLLWSMRPGRPWDRHGAATTVFELAADPAHARDLGKYPDLLLWQDGSAVWPEAHPDDRRDLAVLVCNRGVVFRDVLFPRPPRLIEVTAGRHSVGDGYELIIDREVFVFRRDPEALASRLERWFRFHFHEFSPQVPAVHAWRSPSVAETLRAKETVPCPDCRRAVLTRVGQVGVSLDDLGPDTEPRKKAAKPGGRGVHE